MKFRPVCFSEMRSFPHCIATMGEQDINVCPGVVAEFPLMSHDDLSE